MATANAMAGMRKPTNQDTCVQQPHGTRYAISYGAAVARQQCRAAGCMGERQGSTKAAAGPAGAVLKQAAPELTFVWTFTITVDDMMAPAFMLA